VTHAQMPAAALKNTMKAVVYDRYGSPDVLELRDISRPVVGNGEVLVRVRAAAVSPGDWLYLRGEPYIMRPAVGLFTPRNGVLGRAIAGQVHEAGGGVTRFRPGDEVFAEISKGGFAEYASVPAVALALKPPSLTHEQAAAVPLVGVTALKGLRDHGKIKPGQKVLITGASGGVGSFAVQIAKAFGADVTAVCSTRNADFVRSIGADHVIDYTREDFLHGGHRYDLILDNVGNHSVLECRRALTPGGTLLPNSGAGGRWLDGLPRVAGALALSPFVRQRLRPFVPAGTGADLAVLTGLIEAGKVTPVIDRTYPLSETAAALAYYGQGHTRGKVVITM
jgi:NADPH:quinone reductase-like Zn-dependent oxidoreductase